MAGIGSVVVDCPACDAPLTIPVSAITSGRADNGVVQVDVVPDKSEIELHLLVCPA